MSKKEELETEHLQHLVEVTVNSEGITLCDEDLDNVSGGGRKIYKCGRCGNTGVGDGSFVHGPPCTGPAPIKISGHEGGW